MIRPVRMALMLAFLTVPAFAQDYAEANSGILRWMDKLTGETADIELALGQEAVSGRLTIRLDSCRVTLLTTRPLTPKPI